MTGVKAGLFTACFYASNVSCSKTDARWKYNHLSG